MTTQPAGRMPRDEAILLVQHLMNAEASEDEADEILANLERGLA
ncbi:hypothetical protein [Streptomyces sp. P9-A4]